MAMHASEVGTWPSDADMAEVERKIQRLERIIRLRMEQHLSHEDAELWAALTATDD